MGTLPPNIPQKQPPCGECGGRWSLDGRCPSCTYGELLDRPPDDRTQRERLLTAHRARSAGQWYLVYHDGQNLDPPAPGYGTELLAVRAAWWTNPGLLALSGAFLRELWSHPRWSVIPPLGIPGFGPWVAIRWRVWWQGEPGFLQFERRPGQEPQQSLHGGFDPARLNGALAVLTQVAKLTKERGRPKGSGDYSKANEPQFLQRLSDAVHEAVRQGDSVNPTTVARHDIWDRRTVEKYVNEFEYDLSLLEEEARTCTKPPFICAFHVRRAAKYKRKGV